WEDKFQKFLVAGHYRPPAMIDREDFMTLQVFYRVFGEPRVLISRFKLVAGKIRRNDPFFASAPASNRTKTIPFGDCAGYLGIDADRQELTASEVKSYKVLADKQKPASTTAVSLTKLALDY